MLLKMIKVRKAFGLYCSISFKECNKRFPVLKTLCILSWSKLSIQCQASIQIWSDIKYSYLVMKYINTSKISDVQYRMSELSFVKIFNSILYYRKMPLPKTAEMENKEKDFSIYTAFLQVLIWQFLFKQDNGLDRLKHSLAGRLSSFLSQHYYFKEQAYPRYSTLNQLHT